MAIIISVITINVIIACLGEPQPVGSPTLLLESNAHLEPMSKVA
jgi:hypothetical protein